MSKLQTFQQFLTNQSVQVSVVTIIVNLLLAAFLGYLLERVYVRYGTSLSNRQHFARNFVQLTMTTMLIITIVKSSLALSLGLVGALSIVRFRAAIKEPEELTYLFLSIGVGLGLGADQWRITLVAFFFIAISIMLKNLFHRTEENENLHLTVASDGGKKPELGQIVETLKEHCRAVKIKRFDDTGDLFEAAFLVELEDLGKLEAAKDALKGLGESVRVSFLDNRAMI